MTDLSAQLEAAKAEVARIEREIANGPCRVHGHTWKHIGGKNAGCERDDDCCCSVPVHECTKCDDSDYGDNDEARDVRRKYKERRELLGRGLVKESE